MHTRVIFGNELKKKVIEKESIAAIGHWVYAFHLENMQHVDLAFETILIALNCMEDGVEFEFTYEELNKIADDLIAGREVNL